MSVSVRDEACQVVFKATLSSPIEQNLTKCLMCCAFCSIEDDRSQILHCM